MAIYKRRIRMWKEAVLLCFNKRPTIQEFERLRKTTLGYQNANIHDIQNFVMLVTFGCSITTGESKLLTDYTIKDWEKKT